MASDKLNTVGQEYLVNRALHWGRAYWPLVLMFVSGATIYRTAVIDTIMSTQHPALVYTIFAVLGVTVALSARALLGFEREERLAMQLRVLAKDERLDYLQSLTWKSEMHAVYDRAVAPDFSQGIQVLQQDIESEMFRAEEHLLARLDLPNYLSNSLIGIGLVGTFIGLLSSLADLGTLLSGLQGTSGSGATDPISMFSNMMQQLQKPMKGMGTSFVASLYGLLGSLVMGLVLQSIRKTGNMAIVRVRELLRFLEAQFGDAVAAVSDKGFLNSPAALEAMLVTIKQEQEVLASGLDRFSDAIRQQNNLIDSLNELNQRIDRYSGQIHELGDVLSRLRDVGERYAEKASETSSFGNVWIRVGGIALIGTIAGSIVTSSLAVRSSEQLTRQIAASLRASEQPRLSPAPYRLNEIEGAPAEPAVSRSADSACAVIKDDTLDRIAHRYGVTLKALMDENPEISNPDMLRIGQKIRLPEKRGIGK